jgi:hypothetical protein
MRKVLLIGVLAVLLGGCGANAIGIWVQYPETERSFSLQWSFEKPDPAWRKPDAKKEQVVGVPTWM